MSELINRWFSVGQQFNWEPAAHKILYPNIIVAIYIGFIGFRD